MPPVLASIRSRWLDAATASLHSDPAVAGPALAGSLGASRFPGARAVSAVYLIDGLPLRVDRYAYPASWVA